MPRGSPLMRRRLWTAAEVSWLIENKTRPIGELCEHLQRSPYSIYLVLSRANIPKPYKAKLSHRLAYSPKDVEFIRENYPRLPTPVLIGRMERKPCAATVIRYAKRMGLTKLSPKNHYVVNHERLKSMDAEAAYAVGFILADGCILGSSIEITNTCRLSLENVRRVFGSEHPIHEYVKRRARKPQHWLTFSSKPLVSDLLAIGITPRKSLTATMPLIPDCLFFHFLRGYFDGDGCVCVRRNGRDMAVSFVSGSKRLLDSIAEKIHVLGGLPLQPVTKPGGGWMLHYYAQNAEALARLMYREAGELFMPRKRRRFEQWLAAHGTSW